MLTLIDTHQPHIINTNGTFLSPDINSSEFGLHNFEVFRNGRNCHEGGVLIVVKNILLANKEKHLKQENLESVWWKVQVTGCKALYHGCLYRPPDLRSDQLTSFDKSLNTLLSGINLRNVHLSGDLNLPLINCDISHNEDKYKPTPQYGLIIKNLMINNT